MFSGKVVAITGAGGGIGQAFAKMFADAGAKVSLSDLTPPTNVADALGGAAFACDVGSEAAIQDFVRDTEAALGPVDVFIANAGVGFGDPTHAASASNADWEASWRINVMQSVYASRALLPGWVKRGEGSFVIVASAAGLLTQLGSASYSTTKAAALSFAENLAISHKDDGISVHCVCPQYVRTAMTAHMDVEEGSPLALIEPDVVATTLRDCMEAGEFLVLPHEIVRKYAHHKTADRDRWIGGMAKLQREMGEQLGLKAFKGDENE
jgi:NAD(P)-dependent dehydrogenase (short-subunit alcohol dehydrogenase family)